MQANLPPALLQNEVWQARQRFFNGWHLDVSKPTQQAFWIAPNGVTIAVALDEARTVIDALDHQLDVVHAPGHAYYVRRIHSETALKLTAKAEFSWLSYFPSFSDVRTWWANHLERLRHENTRPTLHR